MSTRSSAPDPVFLHGLTTLPLVGGSVALIGNPTAVDLEPTPVMLEAYSAWLHYELRFLNASYRLSGRGRESTGVTPEDNDGARFHMQTAFRPATANGADGWHDAGLMAQRRAALVLSTVGCGWNGTQVLLHKPPL